MGAQPASPSPPLKASRACTIIADAAATATADPTIAPIAADTAVDGAAIATADAQALGLPLDSGRVETPQQAHLLAECAPASVAIGPNVTFAVGANGTVWGCGDVGADCKSAGRIPGPRQLLGFSGVIITQVSCHVNALALSDAGTVYSWGRLGYLLGRSSSFVYFFAESAAQACRCTTMGTPLSPLVLG